MESRAVYFYVRASVRRYGWLQHSPQRIGQGTFLRGFPCSTNFGIGSFLTGASTITLKTKSANSILSRTSETVLGVVKEVYLVIGSLAKLVLLAVLVVAFIAFFLVLLGYAIYAAIAALFCVALGYGIFRILKISI